MPINTPPLPSSRARNASSTSIVYEKMNITPSAEPDPPFESEDGWHEHFTFKATIQHPEDQDYSVLPLPPTPPIHTDVPPELPVRGHRVSSSIGSTSTGISFAGRLYAKSEGNSLFEILRDFILGTLLKGMLWAVFISKGWYITSKY